MKLSRLAAMSYGKKALCRLMHNMQEYALRGAARLLWSMEAMRVHQFDEMRTGVQLFGGRRGIWWVADELWTKRLLLPAERIVNWGGLENVCRVAPLGLTRVFG